MICSVTKKNIIVGFRCIRSIAGSDPKSLFSTSLFRGCMFRILSCPPRISEDVRALRDKQAKVEATKERFRQIKALEQELLALYDLTRQEEVMLRKEKGDKTSGKRK